MSRRFAHNRSASGRNWKFNLAAGAGFSLVAVLLTSPASGLTTYTSNPLPLMQPDTPQDPQTSELTTGPKDPEEKVKPGAIDADASKEFKTTPSGLKYRVLRKSDKAKPAETDVVVVHYKGWLKDQKIFDSSYRRGQNISFPLNRVVKGWTEGMQLVGEGGMIELVIPPSLGYGDRDLGVIPPNSELNFIVELISIEK